MSPKKNKKETKPKPLDLKLTLENFGPLRKAEIDLKPMTIFIGPNNSGKSYVAMMFYSLFRSQQWDPIGGTLAMKQSPSQGPLSEFWLGIYDRNRDRDAEFDKIVLFRSLLACAEHAKDSQCIDVAETAGREVGEAFLKDSFLPLLKKMILGCFRASIRDLTRSNGASLSIKLNASDFSLALVSADGHLRLKETQLGRIWIEKQGLTKLLEEIDPQKLSGFASSEEYASSELVREIEEIIACKLTGHLNRWCYYLPAARSGILQGYRALVTSAVSQIGWAEIRTDEFPMLTVAVSDLINYLLAVGLQEGSLARMVAEMQNEIIHGNVHQRTLHRTLAPEFWYRFGRCEIPLHRASSAVSELAPIFLFLSSFVEPGEVLMIDEPEAHLHPGAIRILAKYLVRLVRKGVNLIITTHSDYLFGQINNYVVWGKVREKRLKEKSNKLPKDYLNPEEVGAYLFKRDNRIKTGIAYRTEALHDRDKMTEDGLPEEMFIKANDELYEDLSDARIALAKE